MRRHLVAMAVAGVIATGCAGHMPGEQIEALDAYPGLEQQLIDYYDDRAVERDWECTEVQMDTITRAKVVRETADHVVMAIHYDFQEWDGPSGGGMCRGFNTRFFTLAKDGGGLTIESMSGESRDS